jgi:hypothetical protein
MNNYALTTVARLKSFMNKTDSSDDTILAILIDVCTDFIEGYCKRRFFETTYTNEVYDGSGRGALLLKNYPVDQTAPFSVQRRQSISNEDDWDDLDGENFHVDFLAGIVTTQSGDFRDYPRHYRVTYTAGYAFSNVDAPLVTLESIGLGDLEFACWELVKKAFLRRKQTGDIQSESIGDYSVTFRESTMADPIILQILQRYVRAEAVL